MALQFVLGFCCAVGVAASCSGSDGKKADSSGSVGGGGGEEEPGSGGASAGQTSAQPQGGSGETMNGGAGAASPMSEGGAGGEGAASGQGGGAGEGAVSGAGGESGGASGCCDPQVNYSAAGGVLPVADACAPWTMVDTADPEEPTLSGGALRVASSADAENMFFHQTGPALAFPAVFVFEARMRLISGSGSTPSRAPASMTFVYGQQGMKNMVQMSATEVFILSGENTKGTSIAFDTTNDFHTYRIVADTQANTFQLFIDDELEISGVTFAANSLETVQFGEASIYANGISEWEFAKHNAYNCDGF